MAHIHPNQSPTFGKVNDILGAYFTTEWVRVVRTGSYKQTAGQMRNWDNDRSVEYGIGRYYNAFIKYNWQPLYPMSRDALIVGINTYQHLSTLKAPALDAEAIAQCLEQNGEFQKVIRLPEAIQESDGKKPVVSKTLTVSQTQFEQALEQLFLPGSPQAPETALLYFSGHGIADSKGFDKGYLAASDTNPSNPRSGLSLRWLQWLLSESAVKQQIIWLDCCHSGSLLVDVRAANPGHSESRDRCFIASSRDFEHSWEDLNSSYSVLTKALLDGLDPNRLPGRWIDTFALVDYVNRRSRVNYKPPSAPILVRRLTSLDPGISLITRQMKTGQTGISAPIRD